MQLFLFVLMILFVGFALFWPLFYGGLIVLTFGLFVFSPLFRTFFLLAVGLLSIIFVYSNINLF